MVLFVNSHSQLIYFKTFLFVTILIGTVSPLLWIISKGDMQWVVISSLLWAIGSTIIFYPFIEKVYPKMLTKIGFFLLTSILIIVATWLNILLISFLLSENYIFNLLLNTTLNQILLVSSLYILLINFMITKLNLTKRDDI